MKSEIKRYAKIIDDKVFMCVDEINPAYKKDRVIKNVTIQDENGLTKFKHEEVTKEVVEEYITDAKEQKIQYALQKNQNAKEIKKLETAMKSNLGDRGYKTYCKSYAKYEFYEKIIELKFSHDIFNDKIQKELKNYLKNRDKYKEFYLTKQQELKLEELKLKKDTYKDIEEEQELFFKQAKEALKLLKKNGK